MGPAELLDANGDASSHLDRVREILFGAQARALDRRVEALEARLGERLEQLRGDLVDRLNRLGSELREEIQVLAERLKTEQHARADAVERLVADVHAHGRRLEERVGSFEERVTGIHRETRRELEEALRLVRDDGRTALERTQRELHGRTTDVERRKVERSELALLLVDLGTRFAGESGARPEGEGDAPRPS